MKVIQLYHNCLAAVHTWLAKLITLPPKKLEKNRTLSLWILSNL